MTMYQVCFMMINYMLIKCIHTVTENINKAMLSRKSRIELMLDKVLNVLSIDENTI